MGNAPEVADRVEKALVKFKKDLLVAPFGSLAKSETQYLIFRLLIDTDALDDSADDFVLGNELGITAARVRGLRFRLDQARVSQDDLALDEVLCKSGFIVSTAERPENIRVEFTRSYAREHFLAALRARRILADRTLSANVIELNIFTFFDVALSQLIPDNGPRGASADAKKAAEELHAELAILWEAETDSKKKAAAKKVMGLVLPAAAQVPIERFMNLLLAGAPN